MKKKFQEIKKQIPSRLGFGAFVFGILFATFAAAQTTARWQQVYGGPGHEYGYRVRSCMDQGYIVAGSTASVGVSDGYVVRTDSLGLIMWSKYYIGNNVDVLRSLCQLPDSGYIMAGYSNSGGNGGYDGWVLRTDKYGDTLWTRYIGTTDWDFFYDVAPTWDGGFVLAGGTYGMGSGDEDMFFVKLDSLGATVWTKTHGGFEADEARAVVQTSDSMLAACGFTYSLGDTAGDSWILRMNGVTGDTVWTRKFVQSAGADKALGIASGPGRVVVVGEYTTITGDQNAYINGILLDSTSQFVVTNGIAGYESFSGVVIRPNGYLAVLGSTENDGAGNGDMFMFHDIDFQSYTYGTVDTEAGYSIDLAKDNGYIACGYTTGYNSNLPNVYLVKIDSTGASTQLVSIRETPSSLAGNATLFPNPVHDNATITFDAVVPITGELQLTIFDISGRLVMTVSPGAWQINSSRSATCSFDATFLSGGVYQYVVNDGSGMNCSGKFIVTH